jgi:hypothetical protein
VHSVKVTVTFPQVPPRGTKAKLLLSLRDPSDSRPIKLPLVKRTRDEFCEIGDVDVD